MWRDGVVVLLMLLAGVAWADSHNSKEQQLANHKLMTARDVNASSLSNIILQNKSGAPVTVFGLYVSQLAYTTTDCNSPTSLYPSGNAGGAFVMP